MQLALRGVQRGVHGVQRGVLDSLLEDETRHIQYTARLIEAAAQRGQDRVVLATMARRLAEFNEITLNELG